MKQYDPLEEQAKRLAADRFKRFGIATMLLFLFLIVYFIVTITLWLSK